MIPATQKEEVRLRLKKQMLLTLLMGFDSRGREAQWLWTNWVSNCLI